MFQIIRFTSLSANKLTQLLAVHMNTIISKLVYQNIMYNNFSNLFLAQFAFSVPPTATQFPAEQTAIPLINISSQLFELP